jgi:NADH-quinone oxidoreductase subunit E
MEFSQDTKDRAQAIMARYPATKERSALLPLLHLVQAEEGYVSPRGVAFCAETLGLTKAEVGAVATFYTMYKRRPTGDYLVSVCTNTMCDVLGGQKIFDRLAGHLAVGHDETTADGKITLEHAECLAACDYGPAVTVNYDFFDGLDPETAVGLVDQLRAGQRPKPSRSPRLCTLKEMQIQLAGFADERSGAVGEGVAGDPTLRGNRLAQQHGIAVADFDPNTPIPTQADRDAAKRAADAKAAASNPAEQAGAAANKPASDAKPAGDAPTPQSQHLKEAGK